MSIAQQLPEVVPFFTQDCPLCSRPNRMIVKGVYMHEGKRELYPDIGYSFCNCKSIFYTRYENLTIKEPKSFEHYKHPLVELKRLYDSLPTGESLNITMPDPFFCEWGNDPYTFEHWNPRANHILWDMISFCNEAEDIGFEIVYAKRQFDLASTNPKTMDIALKKPWV